MDISTQDERDSAPATMADLLAFSIPVTGTLQSMSRALEQITEIQATSANTSATRVEIEREMVKVLGNLANRVIDLETKLAELKHEVEFRDEQLSESIQELRS